jgi:hypothetical protein
MRARTMEPVFGQLKDLPEPDHGVPARPARVRERIAACRRRAQPAQAAPAPRGELTGKGPSAAASTQSPLKPRSRRPHLHVSDPDLPANTAFCDRLGYAFRRLGR